EDYGAEAQSGLIRNLFHKDNNCRKHVSELLARLNTPSDLLIPQALKDMTSSDGGVRGAVLDFVIKTPPDEKYRADVAKAMEGLIANRDARDKTLKALETWATKDTVPALIALLGQPDSPRPQVIRLLGKLKDERALDALAQRLGDGGDRA